MDSEVVVGPRFNKLCQAIDAAIINAGRQVPCKDFVSGFDFATEAKYEKLLGGAYLAMQSNLLANTKVSEFNFILFPASGILTNKYLSKRLFHFVRNWVWQKN